MDEFERRMDALRSRFVERAAADAAALRGAWAARDMESIRRIAHSLAGNAGMFGHPRLSKARGGAGRRARRHRFPRTGCCATSTPSWR